MNELVKAAESGDISAVKKLLDNGADVNAKDKRVTRRDSGCNTFL